MTETTSRRDEARGASESWCLVVEAPSLGLGRSVLGPCDQVDAARACGDAIARTKALLGLRHRRLDYVAQEPGGPADVVELRDDCDQPVARFTVLRMMPIETAALISAPVFVVAAEQLAAGDAHLLRAGRAVVTRGGRP